VDTVIATVGVATADVTIVAAGVDRASDSISVLEGAAGVAGVAVGKLTRLSFVRGARYTLRPVVCVDSNGQRRRVPMS
jgi:hypothetical protein